jgi:autotransporter-associated beta strand protein
MPLARAPLLAASTAIGVGLAILPAAAQNATWNNPATVGGPTAGTFDFNAAANWNTNAVPADTATFGASATSDLSFSSFATSIGGWTFTAAAAAYTFTNDRIVGFTGNGIVVNGGSVSITNTTGGTLQFFNTSTAGNAAITNNNTLDFLDSSTAGNATITNASGGLMAFVNSSTAGNASITNDGSLQFVDTSTGGNATITNNNFMAFFLTSTAGGATITNNAFIQFNDSTSAGNATINSNPGAVTFTNSSTAGNATLTAAFGGLISFTDTSLGGNATIITNTGGLTQFVTNANPDNARLITNTGGIVDFSATSGLVGNGQISAGSIEGAGTYNLGSNQLTVGGNNLSTSVSGTISDGGSLGGTGASLVKVGTGTLTLNGVNSYTGATVVDGGTLSVNGSILASSGVNVNAGGTLGGNGIVGNTTINGGALAPGNSIGTLAVQGNLVLTAAATYMVQVSGASADRTNVTGTATLAGAVAVQPLSRVLATTTYTIMTAAGTNGTFDAAFVNGNLARNARLSYAGGSVFLTLDPSLLSPSLSSANGNQTNVAATIDNALLAATNLPAGFNALFGLSGSSLNAALTQASGETAVGSQQTTFDAMGQFMGLLTDPFVAGRGAPVTASTGAPAYAEESDASSAHASTGRKRTGSERAAYAAINRKAPVRDTYDPRWSVWSAGFGGSQTTDGNAALGSNNTTSRVFGMAAGADYILSPRTIAGFALAGGGTNFGVANGGSGRSDLFQAGAFIRHNIGPAYLSGALAYGWQDIITDRSVMIAGVDRLRAEFNANAFSGRVEGGYRFVTPWVGGIGLTPYAAGQFTTFDLPAYAEQVLSGVNTFALAYGSKSVTDTRSEFGVRTDKSFAMQDAILTLRGRAAWAHDFNPDRNIAATFQTLPGASFVVNGAAQASDSALTTASAEIKWMNGWSAAATFEGEFSSVTRSYAGKGVVLYVW